MKFSNSLFMLLIVSALAIGCSGDDKNNAQNNGTTSNNGTSQKNNGTTSNNGMTSNNGTSSNNGTTPNNDTTPSNNGTTSPALGLSDAEDVFDFELDVPFAIPVNLGPSSEFWRRPLGENCPAAEVTPMDKAAVPGVVIAYRNTQASDISVLIEMISEEGENGEAPLDDPFIIVYSGDKIPADITQCLAANDTIPEAIDTGDAELEVIVAPGEVITIVGTAFTYSEADKVGIGHALLVATPSEL